MLELLLDIDLNKFKTKILNRNICAGILYEQGNKPFKKVLFINRNGIGYNVFNDEEFPIGRRAYPYVSNVIDLTDLITDFLHKFELNILDLLKIYRMFLDGTQFINKNLGYFGLKEVEVGYKGKTQIIESVKGYFPEKLKLYNELMDIINYKNLESEVKDEFKNKKH